ncbi:MAG TPA: TlpA disulfide reductase family protein, partial [Sporichthya sp.]|nr:TlpA disulfide reductase family protein [Sporichthya sp.]
PLAACGDSGGAAAPAAVSSAAPSATATYPTGANGPILACGGLDKPLAGAKPAAGAASGPARALPDLTLDCLGGGKPVTLRELRGPMVLNVWASWCGPCRDEQPFLSAAHAALGDRVRFLGLAMKDDDGPAREWLSFHGVDWPSLADHKGSIRGPLHVPGPPVTLFVNSAGQIVAVHYGQFTSAAQVQDAIAEHLGVGV